MGPIVWKINPINADKIENGDFEKFPNQKLVFAILPDPNNKGRMQFQV